MAGTLLRSDWQSAVEDELKKHARSLQQAAEQAASGVQSVFQQPAAVQGPDIQQIQQELQRHAQQVSEPVVQFGQQAQPAVQQAQQGVVQFGQQQQQNAAQVQRELQDYVGQISFGQPPDVPQREAAPVAATAGAEPPSDSAGPTVAGAPVRLGAGRDAFISSLQPLAARVAARSGIDPNVMIAIAANETGWGVSKNAKEQNNLFSLQGPAGRASRWATYDSPEQSFDAFVDLISTAPRYKQAWAVRNDPDRFVDALRQAGYVADEPGFPAQGWVDQVKGINRGLPAAPSATVGERVTGLGQQAGRIVTGGAALPHSEEPASATDNLGDKWKTQFGFKSIYTGSYRTGTPHRGIDIVPQRGGIGTPIEAFHPGTVSLIQRDSGGAGGLMVYVKDADGLTHAYMHLQKTAEGLKVGDVVNRGSLVAYMGESGTEGSPHLHYEVRRGLSGDPLDQLIDPRPFMIGRPGVPTSRQVGASTDQQAAAVTAPTPISIERPPVKPPLIADSMQPTVFGAAGRDRPAFQVVQDVVGETAGRAGTALSRLAAETTEFNRQREEFERQQDAAQQQRRQQNQPYNLGEEIYEATRQTGREMSEAPGQLYGADVAAGQQVAETVVQQAKQAGWQPDEQTERITRSLLSTVTPANAILSVLTAGGPGFARMLTEGAVTMATSGVGQVTAQELAANAGLPEWAQVAAGLGGAITGGVTGVVGTRGAIRAIESPAGQAAIRGRQPAELNLGLITGAEAEPPAATVAPQIEPPAGVETPPAPPRPPDFPVTERFPNVQRPRGVPAAPEVAPPPAGVQRLPNYPAGQIEQSFEDLARASREASPDGLAHIELNDLPDDVMPFNVNAPAGQGKVVKLNPGGMPNLDDLRALARATAHKSGFYVDQGDAAAPLVGTTNAEEFFTLNSVMSQRTGVPVQVAESIQTAGLVRKIARDSRAAGDAPEETRRKILEAIVDRTLNPLSSKTLNNKYGSILKGYTTGEAPVSAGAKTSVFAGNYGSAEGRFFDPRITNDVHNWRIMNVDAASIPELRLNKRTGEQEWFYDRPHEKIAANNDQAYRATEAVLNELAREQGLDGYSLQSGMWDGIRAMQNLDPPSYRMWQQGFFQRAIERAERRGVFGGRTAGAGQVNLAEGDIQRVMNSGSVQRALATWGEYLKDPLPEELGITTVSRTFPGKGRTAALRRPSNLQFREAERIVAESDAPIVHGMSVDVAERLGYDADRGIFPWLESSHRVVQASPDEFVVHLPGGNEDTARYVAAQVGRAADADMVRIHVPDYRSQDVVGVYARAEPEQIQALAGALDNMGLPAVVGTGKRSLQVPLAVANDRATINAVEDAALSVGVDPKTALWEYTGRTADVTRPEYAPTTERGAPAFAPTTAERRALLQRGVGAVPEGGAAPEPGAFTAPDAGEPGGLRRARAEATPQFTAQLGGAALGGAAGAAATPEGSDWSDYARNVGIGALTGLAGGTAVGRALGPPRAPALARAGAAVAEDFRAPAAAARPGDELLRATTQEPRNLGEVRTNPYGLREPRAGEIPLSEDELVDYGGELEVKLEDVQARRDAVEEMLRNPSEKVKRPPWAAGYTDYQVAEIARRHGTSPYTEHWWEPLGLESGTGEVRYDVGESGLRGAPSKKSLSATELRAERARLELEEQNITAAYEQMSSAPAEAQFVRSQITQTPEGELPFDRPGFGESEAPEPVPVAEAMGGRDEGARLAQEVVLNRGRGRLRSTLGEVTGEREGVTGRAILAPERVAEVEATPPSARTAANMPNLSAMLDDDMPEIAAQIRKSAEDNPELFEKYRQGVISFDSLRNDLAARVGMTKEEWLKTPVGKGFNEREMMALQAAAIEAEGRLQDLGRTIEARHGVDNLSPEELAYSLKELVDTQHLLAVARGGRSTAGRTLNVLKQRFSRSLASSITAGAEAVAKRRDAAGARRAAARATRLLNKTRELEAEGKTAVAEAQRNGAPRNILQEIDQAYAELDRYNAMSLHEKGDEFKRLAKERADRAAARKAHVRGVPEELLSALRAELKAEQKIFAGRKNTWETMAFWDAEADAIASEKRRGFRGGLYLEQQRKVAQIAAKQNETDARRAFDAELRRRTNQSAKAEALLKSMGGVEASKDVLRNFLVALNDPDPMVAAKFIKGMSSQSNWVRANVVRLAGMLSAPITHMVNVGGSAGNAMVEATVRGMVVPIDAVRAAVTGGERQAYKAELLPMMQAYGPGFLGSWGGAVKIMQTGIPLNETLDLSRVRPGFGSGSDVVDFAVEAPLRALTAEDHMFRAGAMAAQGQRVSMRQAIREGFRGDAAKGRAATIAANLEEYPELAQEASDAAARMIFQERRTVPGAGRVHVPGPTVEAAKLVSSQVVPFVKTPTNITAQGVGLSPLGFVGAYEAARGARAGARAGIGTAEHGRQVLLAEERVARAMLGTAVLGGGLALGAAGLLTANYPEDQKTASTLPQGWRPWSMRLQDPISGNWNYIPLQNLAGIGVPLAMAAIITDPTHRGKSLLDPEEQLNAVASIGSYVLDSTFLQGLKDVVDMFADPRQGAAKFAEPWVGSYGPYSSLMRDMQRTFGVAQRNPREGLIGLVDAFAANYPGVSGMVPEATTPLGDPRVQGATGLARQVPFRYDVERDEPTLLALRTAGVGIPREPKVLSTGGGYGVELTEPERDQLKRMRGASIRAEVEKERTRPRTAAAERTLQTAAPGSKEYNAALTEYNAAMQATVRDATKWANQDFEKQLGKAEIRRREKQTREVESSFLGTPPVAPAVGELNP